MAEKSLNSLKTMLRNKYVGMKRGIAKRGHSSRMRRTKGGSSQ